MADQVGIGGASATSAANGPVYVLNELLCYVQHHMKSCVSNNIAEVISRHFSLEEISEAKDVLKDTFGHNVSHMLKDRRNTSTKAKCVTMAEDIVGAMHGLDAKCIETNFVAKNINRLPKCDPKDLDPYAAMEMVLALEERLKKMENTMGETVARQITQEENMKFMKDTINTHELIIANSSVPNNPSYKDVVASNKKQRPATSRVCETLDDKGKIDPNGKDEIAASNIEIEKTISSNSMSDDGTWIRVGRNGRPIYNNNNNNKKGQKPNSGVRLQQQRNEKHVQQMPEPTRQQQQQQKFRRRRKRVQGSREGETLEGAPPPRRFFFLSRVKKETNDDVINNYIVSKGIENHELQLVSNADAKYKSYKLSVYKDYNDKVMCADMWPRGVCIERWFEREIKKNNNNSFDNGRGS